MWVIDESFSLLRHPCEFCDVLHDRNNCQAKRDIEYLTNKWTPENHAACHQGCHERGCRDKPARDLTPERIVWHCPEHGALYEPRCRYCHEYAGHCS